MMKEGTGPFQSKYLLFQGMGFLIKGPRLLYGWLNLYFFPAFNHKQAYSVLKDKNRLIVLNSLSLSAAIRLYTAAEEDKKDKRQ